MEVHGCGLFSERRYCPHLNFANLRSLRRRETQFSYPCESLNLRAVGDRCARHFLPPEDVRRNASSRIISWDAIIATNVYDCIVGEEIGLFEGKDSERVAPDQTTIVSFLAVCGCIEWWSRARVKKQTRLEGEKDETR